MAEGNVQLTIKVDIRSAMNAFTELTREGDTNLLRAILALEVGQIANVIQAAAELDGILYDRLSKAYHEVAGNDADPDSWIGLKDPDE